MLWAQGPSKLNSTIIGFPITSLTFLKREAITCEFLPCARPCASAISFNHQNSMRWYHFGFPDKGWRHWEVKERARITQSGVAKPSVKCRPSSLRSLRPSRHTKLPGNMQLLLQQESKRTLFSLQTKSQPGAKSPWIKTAVHHRFCFVLLSHLKGNLVSNQN